MKNCPEALGYWSGGIADQTTCGEVETEGQSDLGCLITGWHYLASICVCICIFKKRPLTRPS